MIHLLLFFAVAVALIGGTLALFWFFTLREATGIPESTHPTPAEPPPDQRWTQFGRELRARQDLSEDYGAAATTLISAERRVLNVPALIVVTLLSIIALVSVLTNLPAAVPTAVSNTVVIIVLIIISVVTFVRWRKQRAQQERAEAVLASSNVSSADAQSFQPIGPETGLSSGAQAASQPALVPSKALSLGPTPAASRLEHRLALDFGNGRGRLR